MSVLLTNFLTSAQGEGFFEVPKLVLFTGQSNAVGTAPNADLEAGESDPQANLQIWNTSANEFQDLEIGTNNRGSSASTHGVELGLSLLAPSPIYMAKHGQVATAIEKHIPPNPPGSVWWVFKNTYVEEAVNDLVGTFGAVDVAFVYLQGENDTQDQAEVDAYEAQLDTLIAWWRGAIGSGLPITFIEIWETDTFDEQVNAIFASKASGDGNIFVVETNDGDNITYDSLHYDYEGFKDTIAPRVWNVLRNQASWQRLTETINTPDS